MGREKGGGGEGNRGEGKRGEGKVEAVGRERGGKRRKCNDKQVKYVNSCSRGVIPHNIKKGSQIHTAYYIVAPLRLKPYICLYLPPLTSNPPHHLQPFTSYCLPFTSNLYFHFSPSNSCRHPLHLSSLAIHISLRTSHPPPFTFHPPTPVTTPCTSHS